MASCYPAYSGPCPYCDDPGEPEYLCFACEDQGWLLHPEEGVIPCTECSRPIELNDLEDFRGEEAGNA